MGIGGDVGLVSDASAWCAVASQNNMLTVCNFMEQRPKKGAPLKLSEVVQSGCDFAAKYGMREIIVDHHELQASREHLPDGFNLRACAGGSDAKTERFIAARDAFRQERIRIPAALSKLTSQLSMIVSKPRPGGGTTIVLPRRAGTHLDICSAFILALEVAQANYDTGPTIHIRSARAFPSGYSRR